MSCGPACAEKYREACRRKAPREPAKCAHCHEFFESGSVGNVGLYCGDPCRKRAKREKLRAMMALAPPLAEAA